MARIIVWTSHACPMTRPRWSDTKSRAVAAVFIFNNQTEYLVNQNELDRAVARSTGESVSTVKRFGFILAEPPSEPLEADVPDLGPHGIDSDELTTVCGDPSHERPRSEPSVS